MICFDWLWKAPLGKGGEWSIDQLQYIKIQPKTKDLSTRLWRINTEFVGFIPQSLVLRSIVLGWILIYRNWPIERFHSRGQLTCKFIETKGSVYIRKEFNSHRTGLVHQHGRRFIVLEHQYGCRDVTWKRSFAMFFCIKDTLHKWRLNLNNNTYTA